jgi:PHP family Zn ribbon phosphoesterase
VKLSADLHIHSCLSPCASLDMGPISVVNAAKKLNLTHIALTDHNSTRNCKSFAKVCKKENIIFFPGIEVTSSEEAHILCYFNRVVDAKDFGIEIESSLLQIPLNEEKMGYQVVVNSDEEVEDMVENFLGVASSFSITEIVELCRKYNGEIVPAHIDKPIFSIISQLGFLPDEDFSALELSSGSIKGGETSFENSKNYPILTSSDSHYLETIGNCTIQFESPEKLEDVSSFFKFILDKKLEFITK